MDNLDDFLVMRPPTANRPLLGLTVLVVEDSRFACDAIRLLCQRSGARIRRADSLAHARQHLKVYRPSVVIVDLGLPDGPGEGLIHDLTHGTPRVDVVLGTSGDPDAADRAMDAGADGFIAKPVASLSAFQNAILSLLPKDRQPPGPRLVRDEVVEPDPLALRDDLALVADVLADRGALSSDTVAYLSQFVGGLARTADDTDLGEAAGRLGQSRSDPALIAAARADLSRLVTARLGASGPI